MQYKQLLSPYPQYSGISAFRKPQANSSYHAMILSAEKRFSKSLGMLVSFTGSKLLDDASQVVSFLGAAGAKQDFFNRKADKSISSQDQSRRLLITSNWELPFGKGKDFGASAPQGPISGGILNFSAPGASNIAGSRPYVCQRTARRRGNGDTRFKVKLHLGQEHAADRGKVARVFLNRYKAGMTLGSEATIRYALGYPDRTLTRTDIRIDSPFYLVRLVIIPILTPLPHIPVHVV